MEKINTVDPRGLEDIRRAANFGFLAGVRLYNVLLSA